MERREKDMERQVWQRVFPGSADPLNSDLRQLQREAMEMAACYRNLAEHQSGRSRELLRQLYAGERASAAAMAGLCSLSRRKEETLKLWQPGRENPAAVLERCYHRTRRCMTEYMARSAEAEFGVVFEKLARRAAEHCAMIAEVLGNL